MSNKVFFAEYQKLPGEIGVEMKELTSFYMQFLTYLTKNKDQYVFLYYLQL